jgi:outer membrane protein assembly factor BamB
MKRLLGLTLSLTIIYAVAYTLQSCNANTQNDTTETTTIATDSIETPAEPKFLLDTAYPSVENLKYSITIFDSITSGELSNTDDAYADAPGIFTFRGNPLRNASFCGHIDSIPTDIDIDWTFETSYDTTKTSFGIWGGGTGWTGQSLYVEWSDSMMQKFKQENDSLTENFGNKEIIVSSLCGQLYFINYENGKASRKPIDVRNPIKGTGMIDPALNGNYYIGQGIPKNRPIGALVVDLFEHKVSDLFPEDANAWRNWSAYDASPLVVGDFLFRIGENGTIYKYTREKGKIKLHSTLRYRKNDDSAGGMESSMAVYKNYGYTTDNHGNILCINLNNLEPIWHYDNHDDTDATPVLELEDGIPYLYSGCEMDHQGYEGLSYIVKINGLTGERIWEQKIECKKMTLGEKHFDGGMYSTMLLGTGDCSDLLFTNICTNDPPAAGNFYAISKATGEIVYSKKLMHYAWSSPVAITNDKDEMFVLTFDCVGHAYIIDGKTGEFLVTKLIGINFESSPIVIGNHIVIGSRGTNIYKLTIR